MKVEFKTSPDLVAPSVGKVQPHESARDRAIKALMGGREVQDSPAQVEAHRAKAIQAITGNAPQTELVRNATQVQPEEMSAILPTTLKHTDESIETASVESAPSEAAAPKEEPISTQYAILARKEKALRARAAQQDAAMKAREAALLAKEESFKSKDSDYNSSKFISREELLANPSKLFDMGLTYDQLTQAAMNAPKAEDIAVNNEIRALREELKALRGDQESTKKSFEEQQTKSYQQALSQIKADVRSLVSADPSFETIKATNSVDDVVQLIEKTFNEDGILLSIEDAAKEVEAYLEEEAFKLSQLNKIKKRLQPQASSAASAAAPKQQTTQQQPALKTLTNAVSSSRQMSARERAIAAFKGQKVE